jgi:hypothetical protein
MSPGLFGGKCDARREGTICPDSTVRMACQCTLDADHDGPHNCWRCRASWEDK